MITKSRFVLSALLLIGLLNTSMAQSRLAAGMWRGSLKTASSRDIPFNFEITDTAGRQLLTIFNGAERFKVTDIRQTGDSVFIHMPLFDSEFRLKSDTDGLKGTWIKHLGTHDAAMEFAAEPNTKWRFTREKPLYNLSGRWSAVFGKDKADRDTLVGQFKQKGAELTGTFLSTTGDYRYLEGTVAGDSLYLSCFDGGHAYLFTAKINDDKSITNGKFHSGYSGMDNWRAVRNENAALPDAYSLTSLKPGDKKIAFTFRDLNGKTVSLTDDRFRNKVVIVQIMGSWCPNCMDETNYLVSGFYQKYHPKGVEIVGLAYERTTDFSKSQRSLAQLKTRFNVPYPLLITGYTPAKGDPEKSLPELAEFKGFPTTIIIDKKGDVRRIHTGFSGPGTGDYYTRFTREFEKLTDSLLAER